MFKINTPGNCPGVTLKNVMPRKNSNYTYIRKSFTFDGLRYEVYGKTEEEALEKKLEKLRKLEAGHVDSNVTVKQWADAWYEAYVSHRKCTAKTKSTYRGYLDRVIIPELGPQKLKKVSSLRLQKLLNDREGNSTSDLSKLRMTIKGMFSQAYHNRLIPFDPSEGLTLPATTDGSHRSLTDAERNALIAVAGYPSFNGKPNRSGCWLMTMLRCGLRPGETAALKKTQVDLKRKTLQIVEAKESGSTQVKKPKTEAGFRTVPIPEDLIPWLEKQMTANVSTYFFTQKDNRTPLSETSMRRRWETVKKYMDLELGAKYELVKLPGQRRRTLIITESVLADDLDLYDLRHTYCTDLEKAGVPINVAKVLMGHKDIATTANIYTHSSVETLEAARLLIDAAAKACEKDTDPNSLTAGNQEGI